ncbi:MAG: hypothetical protein ACRDI2_26340, partial [Chloroflexota bacterium]
MPALDAIAAGNNTAGANFGTATVAAGDSLSIRNFPQTTRAQLLGAFSQHVTSAQFFRVRSPLLHDNVQGIRIIPAALVSEGPLVGEPLQELYAQDTLIIEASTAAATGVAEIVLPIYYDQLPGADARLYAPGDVLPLVKAIKPLLVTPASGANAFNVWS